MKKMYFLTNKFDLTFEPNIQKWCKNMIRNNGASSLGTVFEGVIHNHFYLIFC